MVASLQRGATLRGGRYEIRERLRGGPEKQVYLACDRELDCLVALDVFTEAAEGSSGTHVAAREARILAKLGDHPNIAHVQERWEEDGSAYMSIRYLPGGSLSDLITEHAERGTNVPADQVIRLTMEIAKGLAHIHARRILYRDLQPRNVLFDEWGNVRLVDFDTACPFDELGTIDMSIREVVAYMAPEELEGGPVDQRADLYSLGATAFEMSCGSPPHGVVRSEILEAHRSRRSPDLTREDLPERFRNLLLVLLQVDPDKRPSCATDVVERLEQLHADRIDLQALLKTDESGAVEFKSSLRAPVGDEAPAHLTHDQRAAREKQLERDLELSVLKTIAAFLNTEGGTLVIGVADDSAVIGIEVDYPHIERPSRDAWRLTFDELVSSQLGPEVMNWVDVQLEPLEGGTVAVVRCRAREEPTWLGKNELFFVRRTASTWQLSPRKTWQWCRDRTMKHEETEVVSQPGAGVGTGASGVATAALDGSTSAPLRTAFSGSATEAATGDPAS